MSFLRPPGPIKPDNLLATGRTFFPTLSRSGKSSLLGCYHFVGDLRPTETSEKKHLDYNHYIKASPRGGRGEYSKTVLTHSSVGKLCCKICLEEIGKLVGTSN